MRKASPAAFYLLAVGSAAAQIDSKAEVLKAEVAFNEAKIHNDVAALERIVADDFVEINQWGGQARQSGDDCAFSRILDDFARSGARKHKGFGTDGSSRWDYARVQPVEVHVCENLCEAGRSMAASL